MKSRLRQISRRRRHERGAGAVELVIAVPLLMFMILLVIQFAIWEHATSIAQAAAEEGLSSARVQGGSAATGQSRADQVLSQIGNAVLIGPQVYASRTATTVVVQVTGTAETVLPLLGLRLPVSARAQGPVERFVPATGNG